MSDITFTCLGKFWGASGDLFYIHHPDGREAHVYVDSLGETWVNIRVVPEGGYFHSKSVEAWPVPNAASAERILRHRGFVGAKINAPNAHRVRERDT